MYRYSDIFYMRSSDDKVDSLYRIRIRSRLRCPMLDLRVLYRVEIRF